MIRQTDKKNESNKRRRIQESSDEDSEMESCEPSSESDSEQDSSTDSDSESEEEFITDEDSESESEKEVIDLHSDSDSDSDYEPKKAKRARGKELERNETLDHARIQQVIADVFRSKYMDSKVADKKDKNKSPKDSKEDKTDKNQKSQKAKKNKKAGTRIRRKRSGSRVTITEPSSESEENEFIDDESESESDDEGGVSILLIGGEPEQESYDESDDKYDVESDDEKIFMKEKYEPIEVPEDAKPKARKRRPKPTEEVDDKDKEEDVEIEYAELVETKKTLSEQLKKKPKSKVLKKAVHDCDRQIKKLVKSSRIKNAKKYHKLTHEDKKNMDETSYFKTKLSNKEQMRVIRDLKEVNSCIDIDKPYRLALLESNMPAKTKAVALQKLNILNTMEPGDPEYHKLRHWVDAFMRIPFNNYNTFSVSISDGIDRCHEFMLNAKQTLDRCVYGLNDAKLQIMQLVGQWVANPKSVGSAIAIKGPMGTGKTTLVKEGISQILGREFAFIALGGNSDASFLEGHSYTYEGSSWGKIVQILMDAKCMNPVIYFDELDKISDTAKGEEIVSMLIHLTDVAQNTEFRDKFFAEAAIDLSKVLFLFSYNDETKVNPILRDRMYSIQTKGYESKEKLIIARNHLLPKIREQVNFKEEDVIIPDETIMHIVSSEGLTHKEAGVRNLKRCLEIIYTKLNLFRLVKRDENIFKKDIDIDVEFPFTVSTDHVDIFIKNNDRMNPSLFGLYI